MSSLFSSCQVSPPCFLAPRSLALTPHPHWTTPGLIPQANSKPLHFRPHPSRQHSPPLPHSHQSRPRPRRQEQSRLSPSRRSRCNTTVRLGPGSRICLARPDAKRLAHLRRWVRARTGFRGVCRKRFVERGCGRDDIRQSGEGAGSGWD